MAIELYHNPDGSVGGLDAGEVMVAPTQEEFEECCCASEVPCTDCAGIQPSAIATVTGTCAQSVKDYFSGTYLFDASYNWGAGCTWRFRKTGYPTGYGYLYVHTCIADGSFCAVMAVGGGAPSAGRTLNDCPCTTATHLTSITCQKTTGLLRGSFDLTTDPGIGPYGGEGCIVHVTLGG